MKFLKPMLGILLLVVVGVGSAWADRGHYRPHGPRVSLGISVGPLWDPWYYRPGPYFPYPYYYPRVISPVIVQTPQQIYVEQQGNSAVVAPPVAAEASPPAPAFWYFCQESQAYYPYVKECAGTWQKVPAQPPGQ
jgi:hypothetical protein